MKRQSHTENSRITPARRSVAWMMIALQICLAVPRVTVSRAAERPVPPARNQPYSPPPTPMLKVNRTLPPGATSSAVPITFSPRPTEDEISTASILVERLVPVGRKPTPDENAALTQALEAYIHRTHSEDVSALSRFLDEQPESPWRAAVLVNLGILHYHAGQFTQTFPAWEEAWKLGKDATNLSARALVDVAVGELARMNARVGRMDRLQSLFAEIGDRVLIGSPSEVVSGARQGLWLMQHEPWKSFRCGPMALDRIQAFENPGHAIKDCVYNSRSTTNGFSLQQVFDLSEQLGMKLQRAKRSPGAPILLPAVVNWKVGHFAALVKEESGKFLVQDPTFGGDLWISRETLASEASGYFLVSAGPLPAGWVGVPESEASQVFGKGQTSGVNSDGDGSGDGNAGGHTGGPPTCGGGGVSSGSTGGSVGGSSGFPPMAVYTSKAMTVGLHIQDTPVGHTPPRGPAVWFTLAYNHREANQPGNFNYAHFGPKWTFDWISYVTDDPTEPKSDVRIFLPGGGTDVYSGYNATNNTYAPEIRSRSVLTRTSSSSYTLRFSDGSQHFFARPTGVANPRKVFLTRIEDAHGNGADLFYDANQRLISVRDALGQFSTLSYNSTDPYRVTQITDPFRRFASFQYDANGRLTNITDVIGINSSFSYKGSGDFIEALTTPYGTSRFRFGESGTTRWLEMTDPEGSTERVEYRDLAPGQPFADPAGAPKGIVSFNQYMHFRSTYYWDKKAFRESAGDYSRARIMHWLHDFDNRLTGRILESEKQPLENRVWYNYPNQPWAGGINRGMIGKPSKIGRILDDGTAQIYQYDYNDLGNMTKQVDPVGRTTTYIYATNLIDLVEVRQTAGVNDLLQSRTYNAQHLPLTVADGSGHTNRYTYNAEGQLLTATNPRNETTTLTYDTNGYLMKIDGPLPGTNDSTSFTYDGSGRVRTVTDSEDYTLTYDYDDIDHLTRTTYPDGTYDETTYQYLDRATSRDRNGRITRYTHDGNRRLTSVEDPLHRLTRYDWCACGQLEGLIDPMGRTTKWHRDIQGRVIAKEYVDGSKVLYGYEGTTSRLKTITDEKGQVKLYDYLPDENLHKITYLNAENPTPNVTYTYSSAYNRMATMTDGIGLTSYGYYSANTNSGRLAFVDGPLPHDTASYQYDELGRVLIRAIDSVQQSWAYDPLGRLSTVSSVLGTFTNTYVNATRRPATVLYPNGQRADYNYFDNQGDQRLREIHHRDMVGETLSKFDYAYDQAGEITNWVQQAGNTRAENWNLDYDPAQQLKSVQITGNDIPTRSFGYVYDLVGNRLLEQTNGVKRGFLYNSLNQIQSSDESSLEGVGYQWDAENRLVGIVQGANRFELSYDGFGRYVRARSWRGDTLSDELRFVWCGDSICEERDAEGSFVRQRFFEEGQSYFGQVLLYSRDHLGSVRNVTDRFTGASLRIDYSPFGVATRSGTDLANDFGYTGHHHLPTSSISLTRYRAYDPALGSWLSRDPIAEFGGINLYVYCVNNPVNLVDELGLAWTPKDWLLDQLRRLTEPGTGLSSYNRLDPLGDDKKKPTPTPSPTPIPSPANAPSPNWWDKFRDKAAEKYGDLKLPLPQEPRTPVKTCESGRCQIRRKDPQGEYQPEGPSYKDPTCKSQ